jgi:hypothetical protein
MCMVINPRRMRRRVTVLALCLCVYLSVATISARSFISKHKTGIIGFFVVFS